MRIRQVKPSFWSDPLLAELAEPTRLFYIGLWMIADDAGWLRVDVPAIGRDLYGYDPRPKRERRVAQMLDELVAAGRLRRLDCGHAEIPTLTDHQRLAGATKQVKSDFNEHLRRCVARASKDVPQLPAETRGYPQSPATVRNGTVSGQERLGTGRNGSPGASATDDVTDLSEFRRRVPREVALP